MAKYRQRPVVVEAERFSPIRYGTWPDGVYQLGDYCTTDDDGDYCVMHGKKHLKPHYRINTREGDRRTVAPDDWIISEGPGCGYPCNPIVFEATYEPAG